MRTFGTLALFCLVSFLGALMLVDAEEPEIVMDKSRDALVASLSQDIRLLIEKGKISDTDRATAREVRESLASDRPLKTIEELMGEDGKLKGQSQLIDDAFKRDLGKTIEEAFRRTHKANNPPPTVTPSLAHDLYRFTLLRKVFRKAHLRSEALDVLFDRVLARIEMTTAA